ncbi:PadR family transcriptional regulator [Phytoactinopolyspora endophytica]|uniref:PadR family transcriptional regulator n=1 Tax=Phytoactinopolyspora endophytica TaxID=1642495 RepID=UPI00101C7B55|nr:PadR family transcriptional regulator [Phytoactinopolyspora endophytica]
MAKLNLLESVLLGLLARRPSAGYDIRKYLEKSGRIYGYAPQASQIYRQLASLVRRDLLEFEIDTGRGGPDAKVYSPTPAGFRAFLEWVDAPFQPSERPLDAHFQLHFALAGAVSPVVALRIVETELAFRLEQEANWAPDLFLPTTVEEPLDLEWMDEAAFLGDARGNQLASAHISWLRTTSRRLRRYIERTGAVWPDPRWSRLAGE